MKFMALIVLMISSLGLFAAPEVIIPTKEEAKLEIARAKEILDRYGVSHSADPEKPIDWASYLEKAQDRLGKSGSGQRTGSIRLTDSYPIKKTIYFDSHVTLEGSVRAKHHIGSSHGFVAEEGFKGDTVLVWKIPKPKTYYSNFGAGIYQIHVQSREGINGVSFRGAQQACRVENLYVRGFGENATGLQLGGDTYTVRDCFVDAAKGGEKSASRKGSVGYQIGPTRVYSVALNNITVHNCETGMALNDAHQIWVSNYETELTTLPLLFTYQCMGVVIDNVTFRHTQNILNIKKARFPAAYGLKLNGTMADNKAGHIEYPTNKKWSSKDQTLDISIDGDKKGLKITDLKKLRLESN